MVLGFLLKPLRRFFPSVVTGTVVTAIGLSLISVGINSFGGHCAQALHEGHLERAIIPIMIMFIVTAVETIGDLSGITEGGFGLGYGLGSTANVLAFMPSFVSYIFGGSGIVPAAIVAIILNTALKEGSGRTGS